MEKTLIEQSAFRSRAGHHSASGRPTAVMQAAVGSAEKLGKAVKHYGDSSEK